MSQYTSRDSFSPEAQDDMLRGKDDSNFPISQSSDDHHKKKKKKKHKEKDKSYDRNPINLQTDVTSYTNVLYDDAERIYSTANPGSQTPFVAAYTEEPEVGSSFSRRKKYDKSRQSSRHQGSMKNNGGLDDTSSGSCKEKRHSYTAMHLEYRQRPDDEITGNEHRFDQNDIKAFMEEKKFHLMTCKTYIYDANLSKKSNMDMCGCGRPRDKHELISDDTDSLPKTEWKSETHSKIDERKNPFGTIAFQGFGQITDYQAPYVVLSAQDSPEDACNFLLYKWKLPAPKLIVSVVGGAKRFQFSRARVTHLFKRGLIEVATSTGAWIITPGTGTGVYKLIGDAISDYINTEESVIRQDIVLLGITAWGTINNREALENPKKDSDGKDTDEYSGLFPAEYRMSRLMPKSKLSALDANHTHFIMVDDGSQNKYGGEIQWRVKFERFLSEYVTSQALESMCLKPEDAGATSVADGVPEQKSLPIQIVTILVNGGVGSLENIAEILERKPYPIIAIAGSGRAADAVIKIAQLTEKTASDNAIKNAFNSAMESTADNNMLEKLKIIYTNRKYVTVFDFDKVPRSSVTTGLDNAILNALHKLQGEQATVTMDTRKAQMNLALAWNKVTYAQKEILDINNSDYKQLISDKKYMHEVLMTAIIRDLDEFVVTLLDHGIDLCSFVTPANLSLLYKKMESMEDSYSRFANSLIQTAEKSLSQVQRRTRTCLCTFCVQKVNTDPLEDTHEVFHHLCMVGRAIQSLIGDFYPNEYEISDGVAQTQNKDEPLDKFHPAKHLFYWAVMFNRYDMAKIFLRHCKDYLGGAIVGASMYRGLWRESNHIEGVEMTSTYNKRLFEFEESANGILNNCWERNRQQTSKMLVRKEPNWGGATLMSMADNAEMEEFLAQAACHNKLTKIWRGNIALRTPFYWIVLFAMLPPFGVWLLQFARRNNSEPRLGEATTLKRDGKNSNDGSDQTPKSITAYRVSCGETNSTISYCNAIWQAWQAPIVRFIYYIIWYVGFLLIYSVMVMTELAEIDSPFTNTTRSSCPVDTKPRYGYLESKSYIGPLEITTWIICVCNLFEEIRQIAHQDERHCLSKFRDWFSDLWNKVDAISYVILILSILLRFTLSGSCFFHARWMYCAALAFFFLRFSQMFYVIEQLGPKIIMIRKMVIDVIFFLFILVIVLCAFGVMYQALLFPQSSLNASLISSVFEKPYWQMYGELHLEEVVQSDNASIATALILVIFMILTNVLLLNLLIAMFSHTFEEVQGNATILWKYHYYSLVYENADRPYFPGPGTIYKFIKKSCGRKDDSLFKIQLDDEENKKISSLIVVCTENYQKQVQKRKHEDVASKVTNTAERLDSVINQLDDLREDILTLQTVNEATSPQPTSTTVLYPDHESILTRVSNLEKNMERMFNRLEERLIGIQQQNQIN